MRLVVVVFCLAIAVGGAVGYAAGRADDASTPLALCPSSAWANGGGTDYAVSGISCDEIGTLVRRDFAPATSTRRGDALMFGGWECFLQQTAGRHSPVLNVCADGRRKARFLFQ